MVAAWSMWFERSVVNWEARVSKSSVEAVAGDVLRIAACTAAVWLMRSRVLVGQSLMCLCVRGSLKLYLRVE
jgi:hypothetical protein